MTKQTEIREGIARELCYEWWNPIVRWEDLDEINRKVYYHLADAVIKYLHSQGGVLKVERELPKRTWYNDWGGEGGEAGYKLALKDMAGYETVESLIKEKVI